MQLLMHLYVQLKIVQLATRSNSGVSYAIKLIYVRPQLYLRLYEKFILKSIAALCPFSISRSVGVGPTL